MNSSKRTKSPLKQQNETTENVAKKAKLEMGDELKVQLLDEKSKDEEGENYDFLFDQEDDFDLCAFEAAEKEASKPRLDLTKWQRCRVTQMEREKKTFSLILNVTGKMKDAEAEAKCYLQGPWCHTRVAVDNIVSLIGEWDENLQAFKVDKDQGFCVVNPDVLISGTTVVGSLFCRRKAVLQDRFKGVDANNKVVSKIKVIGGILGFKKFILLYLSDGYRFLGTRTAAGSIGEADFRFEKYRKDGK